jgi:CubicO group peptidase (beta-lactamase class C family)
VILLAAILLAQSVPGAAWEERSPSQAGLSREKLDALRDQAGGRGCVVRSGALAYSWGDASRSVDVDAAGAPVLAALLMRAVQDGRVSGPDARVSEVEPGLTGKDAAITWRHLACGLSGYGREEAPGAAWSPDGPGAALFHDALIGKVYSRPGTDVLRRGLADPLGFQDPFSLDVGVKKGEPGHLRISARDFARFGLLILRGGEWGKSRVLPASLTYLSLSAPVPADLPRSSGQAGPGPGYLSFGWWVNGIDDHRRQLFVDGPADLVAALGLGGRHALWILPSLDLVVAWTDSTLDDLIRSPGSAEAALNRAVRRMVESAAH